MTDEKWADTVGRIKDGFPVLEENKEPSPGGGIKSREWIVFQGPLGKMKLERVVRFVVLDKKTIGSRRIGGETTVEYIYSPNETSQRVFAYRFDDAKGEWQEMTDAGIV